MEAEYHDRERIAQIRAMTCGTAGEKTIRLNTINCEMSLEKAEEIAKLIVAAVSWVKAEQYNPYDPDCMGCAAAGDPEHCPMARAKKKKEGEKVESKN